MESEGYFRFKADYSISSKEFYDIYKQWCEDNACHSVSAIRFSAELRQNDRRYNLEATNNIHLPGGRRVRGFVGIEPDVYKRQVKDIAAFLLFAVQHPCRLHPEDGLHIAGRSRACRPGQHLSLIHICGDHGDNHHSGKKTCDRIAEENGVSRASVLRASHYTRGIDIADNLSPGIKQKVFSGEVKFTNEEMSKLVQASVEHRSDVLAQILHPEALEVLESASAELEPEKAEPVPMPTPQTEEFRCYHVPDEFMKVYKSLSRATEMMKNSWKKTLKNNPSYFTDPEKQKVLRFAMQRPANYLTEIETYLEKALAEALEEEKTA